MIIVCDAHIPFLTEAVRKEWPDVNIRPLEPEAINAASVREADILVVRTRTKVNEQLLAGSKVRLVCTATIGYDHVDTAYCDAHGIRWTACPGCNAKAVCEYIEEALDEIFNLKSQISNPMPVLGIVGVGHVGSLVAQMAQKCGMQVLLNDPPKGIGVPLDEIARRCDIITFHTPLDESTWHLCDAAFMAQCKPGALIINAARGGVVDEEALLRSGHPFVLDTWENEPHLNPAVLAEARLASMHIAGYSVEGKRNASQMCLDTIAAQCNLPKIDISEYRYTGSSTPQKNSNEHWLAAITSQLKSAPTAFESLRKSYPLRGESAQ